MDRNVHIIAVGKAVTGMARVAEELFGDHIVNAITVVPEGMITALTEARKWLVGNFLRFRLITIQGESRAIALVVVTKSFSCASPLLALFC